jgi:L-amino acid N-acyltransferase YncA
MIEIRTIEPTDGPALERFPGRVPEGDRTFFKEDVEDPAVVEAWAKPGVPHALAVEEGEVIGYMAVVPLHGWSSHVGEVRVIVDPDHRARASGGRSRAGR